MGSRLWALGVGRRGGGREEGTTAGQREWGRVQAKGAVVGNRVGQQVGGGSSTLTQPTRAHPSICCREAPAA